MKALHFDAKALREKAARIAAQSRHRDNVQMLINHKLDCYMSEKVADRILGLLSGIVVHKKSPRNMNVILGIEWDMSPGFITRVMTALEDVGLICMHTTLRELKTRKGSRHAWGLFKKYHVSVCKDVMNFDICAADRERNDKYPVIEIVNTWTPTSEDHASSSAHDDASTPTVDEFHARCIAHEEDNKSI